MNAPENIILVIIDCLRKDCAEDKKLMPFLNSFLKYKKEAYANAPSTHFAVPAILTGKVPFEATGQEGINSQNIQYYLPKILKEKGYTNIFITANAVTSRYFGYDRYCDYFDDFAETYGGRKGKKVINYLKKFVPDFIRKSRLFILKGVTSKLREIANKQNIDLNEKIRADNVIKKLGGARLGDKNLIVLHLMEPHAPYYPKRNFDKKTVDKIRKITKKLYLEEKKLDNREIRFLREMYTEEVRDSDKYLKEIFSGLKKRISLKKSLIVVTADHGEAFKETGYLKHPSEKVSNMHHIKVPFFSNVDFPKSVVWSNNIYELVLGRDLTEKNFCIGYKKEKDIYIPVSYFDFETKKIVERNRELKQNEMPENMRAVVFGEKNIIDKAIKNVKI